MELMGILEVQILWHGGLEEKTMIMWSLFGFDWCILVTCVPYCCSTRHSRDPLALLYITLSFVFLIGYPRKQRRPVRSLGEDLLELTVAVSLSQGSHTD